MTEATHLQSLSQQVKLFKDGKFTATELVQNHLDVIKEYNPKFNSYITVDGKAALNAARILDATKAKGEPLRSLSGAVISVKDSIPTKDLKTTNNSRLLEDWIPETDASVVARLRSAGAIIIGKTNLNEFGWSIPSESDLNPPPWNPWNPDFMSVGSSSGSGASVTARMASAAIGTDGGGSARLPAGAHNLFAIKPTHGLVSRYGMDHNGHSEISPLARTALDTAIMLEAMAGYERNDDMSWPMPVPEYSRNLDADISGWKIGIPRRFIESAPNEPEVLEAFHKFVNVLKGIGCSIIDVELTGMAEARAANFIVLNSEAYQSHQVTLESDWHKYGEMTRVYLLQGAFLSASDFLNANEVGRAFRSNFSKMLRLNDIKGIVTPTSPFATAERSRRPGEHSRGINACYTAPFNISGHPSMNLPAGFGEAGIPVGAMITGELHDDLSLLQIASAYDEATNWDTLLPYYEL